jgi:Uncharacterized conserved protein (DUF2304)
MTNLAIQSSLVAVGAVAMFSIVFALSRRGLLSLRYALGWMAVSTLLVIAAIVIGLVGGIGQSLPFTPTGLIAVVGLGFLLAITLQLSISLSGHQEAIRELSEANALLEERLARVEQHERDRSGGSTS